MSILAICYLSVACVTYKYNGIEYTNPDKALEAQQQLIQNMLNKIPSKVNPIHISAIVIIPSESLIKDNLVTKIGSPAQDVVDYVVHSLYNTYFSMGDALIKRNLFSTVKIVKSDNPEGVSFSQDYAIYLHVPGKGLAQWYLKTHDQQSKPIPIYINQSFSQYEDKMISWLENIEKEVQPDSSDK